MPRGKKKEEAPKMVNTGNFIINDQTREAILKIIANKPFNAVFGITKAIEKDILNDQEANAVINAIGQFPYVEVAEFFANIKTLFVPQMAEAPKEEAPAS